MATVRRTAGRTVLFSSITIAGAMATLALFPERFVYSMGIAGAVVVLAAGAFALLVLPSLLILWGERISAPSRGHDHVVAAGVETTGRWYRLATRVMRRPAVWATAAVVVLVLLAAPFLHVSFTGGDASALPPSSSAGAAYQLVQTRFADFSEAPAGLVVEGTHLTSARLASYAASARALAGVKAVSPFEHVGGALWESNVALAAAPLSPAAQSTVRAAPGASRARSGHGGGPDGVVPGPAVEPPVPPPAGGRCHRPDRPGDVVRHDPIGGAPRNGPGDEHADHRRHLRHARLRLPVGPPGASSGIHVSGGPAVDVTHHHHGRRVRVVHRLRRVPAGADQGRA